MRKNFLADRALHTAVDLAFKSARIGDGEESSRKPEFYRPAEILCEYIINPDEWNEKNYEAEWEKNPDKGKTSWRTLDRE